MKRSLRLIFIVTIFLLATDIAFVTGQGVIAITPIDAKATAKTKNLLVKLRSQMAAGFMFGHQDDLAYGVGWKYVPGNSDVYKIAGDYPAVQGYELGHLEIGRAVNLDSVPFDRMNNFIIDTYNNGGVITLSWHLRNPLTGKTAWDPFPGTVPSVLPGGSKHVLYKSWLNKVADFARRLKSESGEFIPVIFRPFHELNGSWFWWGKDHCTPEEYKKLWKFTVNYLKDSAQIHHFLYAFNTDQFQSRSEYMERYPGKEWVDIIGFDIYQREHGEQANLVFIETVDRMLKDLTDIAHIENKIPAITEFGYNSIPDSLWWTNVLHTAIGRHKISYILAWRNAGLKNSGEFEYYVPYPGQISEKDFKQFHDMTNTLFLRDIETSNMYE